MLGKEVWLSGMKEGGLNSGEMMQDLSILKDWEALSLD
jgi:hypothetical protein